jgi:hypothetical protein
VRRTDRDQRENSGYDAKPFCKGGH